MGRSESQEAASETWVQVDFHKLRGERSRDDAELTKKKLSFIWFLETNDEQESLALVPGA